MKKSYSVFGNIAENYTVGSRNKVIDYINIFISEKTSLWTNFGLQISQLIISNFSFLQRNVWHGFLIHRSNVLQFLPMQINPLNRCLFLSTPISRIDIYYSNIIETFEAMLTILPIPDVPDPRENQSYQSRRTSFFFVSSIWGLGRQYGVAGNG